MHSLYTSRDPRFEASPRLPALPVDVVSIPGAAESLAKPLPSERADAILAEAREGLELLRAVPNWAADQLTAGIELEVHTVDAEGRRSPNGPLIVEKSADGPFRIVGETGLNVFEINSSVRPFGGGFLADYERELRSVLSHARGVATRLGGDLCLSGTLPSIRSSDISVGSIWPSERYKSMLASLTQLKIDVPQSVQAVGMGIDGETITAIDNRSLTVISPTGAFRMESGADSVLSLPLQVLITSIQLHWSVPDISQYLPAHRTADLVASLMVAVSANSPLVAGVDTGLKASRLALWQAGNHPGRSARLGDRWIEDPFEQFAQVVSGDAAVVPLLEPRSAGKHGAEGSGSLTALIEHSKTVWPVNRTTVSVDAAMEKGSIRIEHRPVCTAPTVTDNIAQAALFYGLMSGLPGYLQEKHALDLGGDSAELERRLPFGDVEGNLSSAAAHGLQAIVRWVDGSQVDARSLLKELLPVAAKGLESQGVPASDIDRYLGVMASRLDHQLPGRHQGTSPADVQLHLAERYAALEPHARGEQVALALSKAFLEDLEGPQPQDIVTWISRNGSGERPVG